MILHKELLFQIHPREYRRRHKYNLPTTMHNHLVQDEELEDKDLGKKEAWTLS